MIERERRKRIRSDMCEVIFGSPRENFETGSSLGPDDTPTNSALETGQAWLSGRRQVLPNSRAGARL